MSGNDLPMWLLTLPAFIDINCDPDLWSNPYTWPGGWNHFENKNAIVIRAKDESQARTLAVEHDGCAIWLDHAYARCQTASGDQPGVVLSASSGADNE